MPYNQNKINLKKVGPGYDHKNKTSTEKIHSGNMIRLFNTCN